MGRVCGNGFWGIFQACTCRTKPTFRPFLQVGLVGKGTPLPLDNSKESLGGAIQIDSDAREVRYWLDQQEVSSGGSHGSRQRAFLHPSSLLFKASLMLAVMCGDRWQYGGNHWKSMCSRGGVFLWDILRYTVWIMDTREQSAEMSQKELKRHTASLQPLKSLHVIIRWKSATHIQK